MECTICLKTGIYQQEMEIIKSRLDEYGDHFNVCDDKFDYEVVECNMQALSYLSIIIELESAVETNFFQKKRRLEKDQSLKAIFLLIWVYSFF
jgi:hypothetical protein